MTLTSSNSSRRRFEAGLSRPELLVILLTLFAILGLGALGASSWKGGADSAQCIVNIREAQQGVRAWQNLFKKEEGDEIDPHAIVSPGGSLAELPDCPSGNCYEVGTRVPARGDFLVKCGQAGHDPKHGRDW